MRTFLICCWLLLAACASGPKIRVDADPRADLGSYRTFAFFEPAATDVTAKYTTLVSSRLRQATRTQLERLGFIYSEKEPDLLVNFTFRVVEKRDTLMSGGFGYYNFGYYPDYRGHYGSYPATSVYDYREGTLTIDLADVSRNQMIWQGIAEGEIDEDSSFESPALDSTVAKIFSNFPNAPKK